MGIFDVFGTGEKPDTPRMGVPYKQEFDHDVEQYEDVPNRDESTVEQIEAEPVLEEPVPVRIVETGRPTQSIRQWRTSRVSVPPNQAYKLLGYVGNRDIVTVRNEDATPDTNPVAVGPDGMVNLTTGYHVKGDEKTFHGTNEIWAYHEAASNVTVQLYWESVTELS